MSDGQLTAAEVQELDSYGPLTAFTPLSSRALELWERELLYGRADIIPHNFEGLKPR